MGDELIAADAIWGWPGARGVLVRDGMIRAVLAGHESEADAAASVTRVEGILLPGLTDAHSHAVAGADLTRGIDLTAVSSLDDLRQELHRAREAVRPGQWLLGWGLAYSPWSDEVPSAAAIEQITGEIPIALRFFDGHSMLTNGAGLRRAGIDRPRELPGSARFVGDENEQLTGLVLEAAAITELERFQPAEANGARRARVRAVLMRMAASGLTGAHLMDGEETSRRILADVENEGPLPLRLAVHPVVAADSGPDAWNAILTSLRLRGERWHSHGVKFYIDGTIDNGTAWLRSADRDGASNESTWTDPELYAAALLFFARNGVPTATHAIGDAGILFAARAIAAARHAHPAVRHRIEHLELTGSDVLRVVRQSGAVASVQPTHCTHFVHPDGSDNWSLRVGERRRQAWRIGSMQRAGIPLALGSDWPIADFTPLPIIAAATLRRAAGTRTPPIGPDERLSVVEAIAGYTSGAAFALGTERTEGRIAAGYRADFTVLGTDPREVEPDELPEVPVTATFVAGRRVDR